MHCNASTDLLVKRFSFTIAYVDPDIAGQRVGENYSEIFSWHWPGNDEWILAILLLIIKTTIVSIVNAAIPSLQDPSHKIRELWGCREEPNGVGGLYPRNVTPIFYNNPAAGWVKVAMKLNNPKHFSIFYRGQQANCTAAAQMSMCGGCSFLPLDVIILPPAEDMINHIGDESDDYSQMWHPHPTWFPPMKTGFQKFEWKLQNRII